MPSQVLTKDQVVQLRFEYENGQYKSVAELASKYGINLNTLNSKIKLQGWNNSIQQKRKKINQIIEKRMLSKAEVWQERVSVRMEKDWSIIDKSMDGIGGEIDVDAIVGYSRARKLVDDMKRRAIGLVDPGTKLDITTGGKSLGEDFASAMDKLRSNSSSNTSSITSAIIEQAIEAEIVDDDGKD